LYVILFCSAPLSSIVSGARQIHFVIVIVIVINAAIPAKYIITQPTSHDSVQTSISTPKDFVEIPGGRP